MAECFVGGVYGKKVITLSDCTIVSRTYGDTLTFPNGVTWGDIDEFVAVAYSPNASSNGQGFAKIGGALQYANVSGGNWSVVPYNPPSASDTYVYMFIGSYAGTPKEMIAILK